MKKDWIARELTVEIIVGSFMVMVLLGLGYFTIILSREAWFAEKTYLDVVFQNVMGLREGDNAVVRGMPVGMVRGLELEKDGVHVQVALDKPVSMHEDYRITVVATSVLGGRYLEIEEGSDDLDLVPLDRVFQGTEPNDLVADAAEMIAGLKDALLNGGIVDDLKVVAEDLKQIVGRVNRGEGTLGRLLSADDSLYTDLSATVASLKEISGRLERGDGTVGRLLSSDDTLYEDLSATVASLKQVTARIEEGKGTLGRLLSEDDRLYQDLSEAVASVKTITGRLERGEGTAGRLLSSDDTLYKDLAATVASLREVAGKIERGEGLVGRLVNDDSLYTEIEAVIGEVRATVDDMRETTPVVSFTSILFGAL